MKLPKLAANTDSAIFLAVGAVVAIGIFLFLKKQLGEAASAAGGLVSGNNAITEGTVYAGGGVLGTVGAATNSASGGVLESIGDSLGSWWYDVVNGEYDPNAPTAPQSRKQAVGDQFYNQGVLTLQ